MSAMEKLILAAKMYVSTYDETDHHPTPVEEARCMQVARDALKAASPYPGFCGTPIKCAGLGSCPRDPCCAD